MTTFVEDFTKYLCFFKSCRERCEGNHPCLSHASNVVNRGAECGACVTGTCTLLLCGWPVVFCNSLQGVGCISDCLEYGCLPLGGLVGAFPGAVLGFLCCLPTYGCREQCAFAPDQAQAQPLLNPPPIQQMQLGNDYVPMARPMDCGF